MRAKTLVICLVILVVSAQAGEPTPAAAFEKMKALAGKWETSYENKPIATSLEVIANGSAVMQTDHTESMVTMFHMDGPRLMLTHYCGARNQPRMVGQVRPDGAIEFNFLDATNLPDPNTGHMHRMILTINDADHFTQQWFFSKDGKTEPPGTFKYTRKK